MKIIPRPSPCTLILHPDCTHTHTYTRLLKVTTLSAYESSKRISGKLHKVSKLVQIVDKATKNFVAVGEEIASENPEFQVWFTFVPRPVKVCPYILQAMKSGGGRITEECMTKLIVKVESMHTHAHTYIHVH